MWQPGLADFIALLCILGLETIVAKTEKCVVMESVNLRGKHIQNLEKIQTKGECCDKCHKNENCVGYTYYKPKSICWLKDTVLWREKENDENFTSGIIENRFDHSCSNFPDMQFNSTPDLKILNVPHAAVCCSNCTADSHCHGFTYKVATRECRMYSHLHTAVYRTGFESGIAKLSNQQRQVHSNLGLGLLLAISLAVNLIFGCVWAKRHGYFTRVFGLFKGDKEKVTIQFESLAEEDNVVM